MKLGGGGGIGATPAPHGTRADVLGLTPSALSPLTGTNADGAVAFDDAGASACSSRPCSANAPANVQPGGRSTGGNSG